MEGAEILQGQGHRGDLAAAAIAEAGHDNTTRRLAQARDAGRGRSSRRPSGPPGNRFEKLAGDRAGQYSIRINRQWRICFRWSEAGPEDVEIVDYH
jgi:plasmid maintenance system killer protein